MKALAAVLLGLVLVLAGCAAPAAPAEASAETLPMDYSVGLDASLSPDDVDGVLAALQGWTTAAGVTFAVTSTACAGPPADGSAICIYQGAPNVTVDVVDTVTFAHFGAGPLGTTYERGGRGGQIELHAGVDAIGAELFRSLVTHEVGHAMGLGHIAGDDVMNASIQIEPGPMPADVASFVAVHAAGAAHLADNGSAQ